MQTHDGRSITGMVAAGAAGEVIVLQSNGQKLTLASKDIAATRPSRVSAMPAGLLDPLTLEEVADLMTFLQSVETTEISRRPRVTEPK